MLSLTGITLIASLFSAVAQSASSSSCNPMSATCSPDKALATAYSENFEKNSTYFENYKTPAEVHYTDEGLQLTLAKRFDNPSIVSKEYILFGRVEALVKAANGTGIISTVYLQSDVEDEIDWEWFGGDGSQVATDYFSKGNVSTYDRGTYYEMSDPRLSFHNYTIDWTEDLITWYVDGDVARTLKNSTDQGYPETPCRLFIGLWAGGDSSNAQGTIEWAGGDTDYSDAPFNMYVKKLVVSDYSSGSEYSYEGTSGDLSSIKVSDGEVNGRATEGEEEFEELVEGGSVSDSGTSSTTSSDNGSASASFTRSLAAEAVSSSGSSSNSSSSESGSSNSSDSDDDSSDSSASSDTKSSSSSGSSSTASATESSGGAGTQFGGNFLWTLLTTIPVFLNFL